MPLSAPLLASHLALSPVVAVVTPSGSVALLDPQSLAPRRTIEARASSLFASGRRLLVVEPGDEDATGAVRALDVGARVVETSREELEGDATIVTARGAGALLGRAYAGAYLAVVGGAGHAVPPPTSTGDTGAVLWTFHEQGGWWTLAVHPFDGATLGPSTLAGAAPARGTGCGARALDVGGALAVVAATTAGVELVTHAGVARLGGTQPCVEDVVALGGGHVAVLLGPVAELVSTAVDRPWRLDAQLPHTDARAPRLARGVRDGTLLVATDGPLVELDLAAGTARLAPVDASAVAVLR